MNFSAAYCFTCLEMRDCKARTAKQIETTVRTLGECLSPGTHVGVSPQESAAYFCASPGAARLEGLCSAQQPAGTVRGHPVLSSYFHSCLQGGSLGCFPSALPWALLLLPDAGFRSGSNLQIQRGLVPKVCFQAQVIFAG